MMLIDSGFEVMSNFDHEINYEVADLIKASGEYAGYPGWGFYGYVYYLEGLWYCEVRVYGSVSGTLCADSLEELRELVCNEYGWD